jgi:23S rRNA pseudouridine1911/1915/1917 synthase
MERYHIIYEDRDIVVVDKPAGLLTVPIPKSSALNLFDLLKQHLKKTGPVYVVHRIDRFTTGVVMFARNKGAFEDLKQQFIDRSANRMYRAIVHGVPAEPEGTLVHHMKLIKNSFKNVIVKPGSYSSTQAVLHYRVAEAYKNAALVDVMLETGLKNQIRVQFAEIGHPIIGDHQYGHDIDLKGMERHALHAYKLGVVHPSKNERMWFESPLPGDMQKLIGLLKNQ